jgi:hypothetical protein
MGQMGLALRWRWDEMGWMGRMSSCCGSEKRGVGQIHIIINACTSEDHQMDF